MLLSMWWLYLAGVVLLAFVVFQAWDRRRNAEHGARQEKNRVDRDAAARAQEDECATHGRRSAES